MLQLIGSCACSALILQKSTPGEHPGRAAEPGTEPLEHDAGRTASADRPRSSSHRVHAVRGRRPARLHRGGRVRANEGARGPKRQVPVLDVRHHAEVDDKHDARHAVGMRHDLLRTTTHGGHLERGVRAYVATELRVPVLYVVLPPIVTYPERSLTGYAPNPAVAGHVLSRRGVPKTAKTFAKRLANAALTVYCSMLVVRRMEPPAGRPETVRTWSDRR